MSLPPLPDPRLERLMIDSIRVLAMDAVQRADSGHPGTPMALAPLGYALWTRHLRHSPAHPSWTNRDRFVLSCGHASMLLYSLLHLTGYDLPLEELCKKAVEFGYDGLELACWGDHFEVRQALEDDTYCSRKRDLLEKYGLQLFSISNHLVGQAVLDRIDERMSGEHTSVGVDTGFTELDALMGGLHNSELIILAARPSMGKTALALNIVEYVTLKSNIPTLLVSLEMSSMELADRLLSSVAKVDGARLPGQAGRCRHQDGDGDGWPPQES